MSTRHKSIQPNSASPNIHAGSPRLPAGKPSLKGAENRNVRKPNLGDRRKTKPLDPSPEGRQIVAQDVSPGEASKMDPSPVGTGPALAKDEDPVAGSPCATT